MISNILVVSGIIIVAIFIVAYKSKRQQTPVKCGCGKSETGLCDNSHAAPDIIIVSENAADMPPSGSNTPPTS
jgi:hypothetical protein